jgi:hypothetical protein
VKLPVLAQQFKTGEAIGIARKDDLSCIPALNMMRNIGNHDPRQSSHSLTDENPAADDRSPVSQERC